MAERPQTSKPRGVCQYFRSAGGCRNGDMCKFLHGDGESLSPYDKNKTCKFYAAGFCKRGEKCWFRHVSTNGVSVDEDEPSLSNRTGTELDGGDNDVVCSICQEKPVTYGLLEMCSHVFCLECIRGWRDPVGKSQDIIDSGNTKRCPYCRVSSKFVTPSSVFYRGGDPHKETAISNYRASMSRIPCKHFERSRPGTRYCPFGKDCFYQHKEADGTVFVFDHGVDYYIKRSRRRHHRRGQATNVTLLDMLINFPRGRTEIDVFEVLAELRPELRQLAFPPAREGTQEDVDPDPSEVTGLLNDILARLEGVFNHIRLSSASSEDGPAEEGQELQSRPSILATPDESSITSVLPLTRAFMDRNMPSDIVDSLTVPPESEGGEGDHDEGVSTQDSLPQSESRRYSLPDLAHMLGWADELGSSTPDPVRGMLESDHPNTEQPAFEESLPLSHVGSQGGIIPGGSTFTNNTEAPASFTYVVATMQHRGLSEPHVEEARPLVDQPATDTDGMTSSSGNLCQDCESRNKPEARNEPNYRRAKANTSVAPCTGRRNGGHSFVTDGRGRVVATDDWAYSDDSLLSFRNASASVMPLQSDPTTERNEPTSVGLGALDDLD